ncbi:MAG: hypothetical protein KDL87_13650, partial [Verrucomicrobiae bacterium]|nr:hypothetical protein [Verrucomicrobiae bacterium]
MIHALRKVISIQGDRLVTRHSSRMGGESPTRFVWVAKSGDDPRAWFRPDARFNQASWRQGRFPEDGLLVPLEDIQKAKRWILDRIRKQCQWRGTEAALRLQEGRAAYSLRYFEERRQRHLELRKPMAALLRRMPAAARVRPLEELVHEIIADLHWEDFPSRWRLRSKDLPEGCPFDEESEGSVSSPIRHAGYRPANSEFLHRRSLLCRWLVLDRLERWLAQFPEGALDFIHRHGFRERRWHLLNLWIRVPDGRELFDEVPALAMALASGWCFRGRPEPNLFRGLRRLTRRKRTATLAWL